MNMALINSVKLSEGPALKPLDIARKAALAAADKKASDIQILDIGELTSFADYFVICSAPSERQVQAIVRNVQDSLSALGIKANGVEGLANSNWVLIDYGDIVFHCFSESARQYYDLEGFWIDAKRISFE
jgi:ribosome-associated protein